jgi:hypothetical protein
MSSMRRLTVYVYPESLKDWLLTMKFTLARQDLDKNSFESDDQIYFHFIIGSIAGPEGFERKSLKQRTQAQSAKREFREV